MGKIKGILNLKNPFMFWNDIAQEEGSPSCLRLPRLEDVTIMWPERTGIARWLSRQELGIITAIMLLVSLSPSYCGEHLTGGEGRVPCPLDPAHSCPAQGVAKHLLVCNSRAPDTRPGYLVPGINKGDCDTWWEKRELQCAKFNTLCSVRSPGERSSILQTLVMRNCWHW